MWAFLDLCIEDVLFVNRQLFVLWLFTVSFSFFHDESVSCITQFKTPKPAQLTKAPLSCSSQPHAPTTEDGRTSSDLQFAEVGSRVGSSTGSAPSEWPTEPQSLHWPAGVPPGSLCFPFLFFVSPLYWLCATVLSSPFFFPFWRDCTFLLAALPFLSFPLSGCIFQPPT